MTGFPQVHVHIDESGRDDRSARLVDLGVARVEVLAKPGDQAVALIKSTTVVVEKR